MMKKSMDDDILRQKIIALLKESGSTSSDSDLNAAVMNMLKILPPPVVKLDAKNSLPVSSCLLENEIPYPPPKKADFTFIDLFAGIGGFRLAFQKAGGRSIFSSEWDEAAQKTYEANYGEIPVGDIRAVDKDAIPAHDVLCAGFPCQPFSLAGVSKKNSMGRATGFEDQTQGTLFFEIKEILARKRPAAFMLENVKNLPKYKTVIEVRGCFWHRHPGCRQATMPSSNVEFWQKKFKRNVDRDRKTEKQLNELGWNLIVVWECELKSDEFLKSLPSLILNKRNCQ